MKRRVALAVMAFLVVSSFAGVNVRAVTVNDIVVIVSDYVNDSKVVAGALLNFTGSPPMVFENVTFQWFNPNGSLVYETASQPDGSGLARSNHTVDQTGEWWVNASYSQPPDIFFHNDSFQVLDEHWNSSSRVVERDLMVGEGATLTIDPGAAIAFDNGTRLSISGTLIAQGAWDRTIVFTSNSSSPGKGDWDGVYFYAGSESSVFDFAKVEYSENGAYVQSAATAIQNCTFENNTHGIRLSVSTSLIYNNTMINNGYGFRSYLSHPVLVLNIAVSNVYGFFSEGSALFVSQMNTAQGNEQVGFHLDFTTVQSTGDTSVGSLVGLRLGSSAGRIEAGNISGLDDGVYGYDSSATFYNSTVGGSLRDFFLEAGSSLVIVNSTFGGKVSAGNGCPACYLFVRNYLTIRTIVHETSEPVENATVKLTDNGMEVLFNLTGSQGYIWNITLAHETYDDGVRRDNDTMVWVTHPTLVFANQGRVDMNLSHVEIYEGSTVDTDGDGEPDFSDLDDDNDDLSDETEDSLGTDPLSNDTDGDVMPDGWEHFNALDPKDPSDADEDFDGDGFTSLEEYQSGTNPRDPHSHPQVEDQQESDYLSYLILLAAVVLMTIALIVVALILKRRRKES